MQVPPPKTIDGEENKSLIDGKDDGKNTKSLIANFDTSDLPGNKNPLGVYDAGDSVTVSFDDDRANVDISGEDNIELVAARYTPEDGEGIPESTGDALDLLSDIDKANANASFEILNNDITYSGGEYTDSFTFDTEGQYVLFAAVTEDSNNGFETTNSNPGDSSLDEGNVSVDGDVAIIGMDQLSVQQKGTYNVGATSDVAPGNNITLSIDAGDLSTQPDVTHAVAVYDKSKFEEEAEFDLVANSSAFGKDFSFADDSQLEHNINEVNGIARIENGTTINGDNLSDGKITAPRTPTDIVDFLTDEAGTNDQNVDDSKSPSISQMDASTTVVNGESPKADINVETFSNFSEGTYRYVAVSALDDAETQARSTTGTLTISSSDGSGDDDTGSGGGGGGGGSADDAEEEQEEIPEEVQDEIEQIEEQAPDVEQVREELEQTDPDRVSTPEIVDNDPDTPGVQVTPEEPGLVRQVSIDEETAAGSIEIREYDNPPESASESVTAAVAREAIEEGIVEEEVIEEVAPDESEEPTEDGEETPDDGSDSSDTTTAQEVVDVVAIADISPDSEAVEASSATVTMTVSRDELDNSQNAFITKEQENSWTTLETEVAETSGDEVTLEAQTDSFSLFAVTEVDAPAQTEDDEEVATEDSQEEDDGSGSTAIIGLVLVVAVVAAVAFLYRQQQSGEGGL